MPPEARLGGGMPAMMCCPRLQLQIQAARIQFCKWPHDADRAVVFCIYLTAELVNWCNLHQILHSWYTMLRKVLEEFVNHNVVLPMQVFDQLQMQAAWSTGFVAFEDLEHGADVFCHER